MIQEPVGAGKLAVEAHLVVLEAGAIRVGRNRLGADKIGLVPGGGFIVEFVGIVENGKEVAAADVIGGVFEFPVNAGGFGVDDATVAPKGVGDFQDEVFLEDAFWFEFIDQGVDEVFVLGAVLGEMGRFEDNVAGMKAMGDGVAAGDSFALGRLGSGGFSGVTPIGRNLFCAGGHWRVLCRTTRSRILGGCCGVCVRGGAEAASSSTVRGRCLRRPVLAILHPCQI